MPGAGRSEPRAAGAGLALTSAPALQQSPQQGPSLHFFCFTQDTVGHWGLITSIKACGATLWAPLPLQLPLPPHSACTVPVLLLHRVPHLGLVLVGGEGALCESSPHPVTNYCTFTLTNSAFPKVGMELEAQLNSRAQPAQPQSSHTAMWGCTLAPLRDTQQLPDSALKAEALLAPPLLPWLGQRPVGLQTLH